MKHSLIALLSLVLWSCSKNNDTNNNNNNSNSSEFKSDAAFMTAASSDYRNAALLQPDGKLVVSGNGSLYRINKDGSTDATFNAPASLRTPLVSIYDMALASDGKIYVCGTFTLSSVIALVARLNADGTLDNSFTPIKFKSPAGNTSAPIVDALCVLKSGKLMVGGNFTYEPNGTFGGGGEDLVRLNTDGSWDNSFKSYILIDNGYSVTNKILEQSDSKLLVAGTYGATYNGQTRTSFMRLNDNGTIDLSFKFQDGLIGNIGFQGSLNTVLPLNSGKFLIGGNFNSFGPSGGRVSYDHAARIDATGNYDLNFASPDGGGMVAYDFATTSNNRVFIARYDGTAYTHTQFLTLVNENGVVDSTQTFDFKTGGAKRILKENDNSYFVTGIFENSTGRHGVLHITK